MINLKGYRDMNQMNGLKIWLLYAVVFTLPMYIKLNNYLLAAFLAVGLVGLVIKAENRENARRLAIAWPVLTFFLLAVLACIRSWSAESFQYLERYWSLVLIPLVLIADAPTFYAKRRSIFLALAYGTLFTLILCYGNVFWNMYVNSEPINHIYLPKYVGSQFTEFADTHPAYLGLFALTSIVFLLNDTSLPKTERIPHIILLILGLFQLAGRTALLLLLVLFVFLLVIFVKKYLWQVLVLFAGIAIITIVFMNYGSPYMSKRLFSIESYTDNNRIARWEVSYDIFRENPVFGVGYDKVREMRKTLYDERNLPFGREGDYNAHNQFLEYLSTNGAIGGFIYVVSLVFLLLLSLYKKDLLFVFLFAAFLIANMTESMMVRIKGIEYFAIFATIFLCGLTSEDQQQPSRSSADKSVIKKGNRGQAGV